VGTIVAALVPPQQADIDHWQGATPDAPMTQLVITGIRDGESVIWQEKISDAEHLGRHKRRAKAEACMQVQGG
jgi:hypothetical protein